MSFVTTKKSILSISSNHVLTDNDNVNIIEINSSGSTISLTLPSAANNKGRNILAKVVTHSNLVTITGTIDNETNFYMNNIKDFINVYSNGTEWKKIDSKASYVTGWVENLINGGTTPEWRNVHLSASGTADGNINHGLNCGLDQLSVRVLISTDGTDANSFEVQCHSLTTAGQFFGLTFFYIDDNNLKVQTGLYGLAPIDDGGIPLTINTNAYYYKIIVKKLI
jgi:hypothetical protein